MTDPVAFKTADPSSLVVGFRSGWIQCRMGLKMAKDGNGPSRSMLMRMYEADEEGTLKDNSGGD